MSSECEPRVGRKVTVEDAKEMDNRIRELEGVLMLANAHIHFNIADKDQREKILDKIAKTLGLPRMNIEAMQKVLKEMKENKGDGN